VKRSGVILLLLLVVGFAYGLHRLFKLRFEAGDIYPAYSSFRTDPLGTKALYESFGHLLSVDRNFKPLPKIAQPSGTAMFVLGVEPKALRMIDVEVKDLEDYVIRGGRLVISFYPAFTSRDASIPAPLPTRAVSGGPPAKPKDTRKSGKGEDQDPRVLLSERWKFALDFAALERDQDGTYKPVLALKQAGDELPDRISCHTALWFDHLDPVWREIYARTNDRTVLMERKLGSGTIVLAADSYWFSNEALLKERYPRLLAWFSGPAHSAIFDETHLGVAEDRGIAALARKYRLHGFVAGLLVLAGLFVWRYAFSLIPPREEAVEQERGEFITGKESAAGFTNLLRRNISSRELLKICLEEWNKSCRSRVAVPRLEKVQAIIDTQNALPERQRNPIETYRRISEALARTPARIGQEKHHPSPNPLPVKGEGIGSTPPAAQIKS